MAIYLYVTREAVVGRHKRAIMQGERASVDLRSLRPVLQLAEDLRRVRAGGARAHELFRAGAKSPARCSNAKFSMTVHLSFLTRSRVQAPLRTSASIIYKLSVHCQREVGSN